jgi:Protein of unknown function (DUF4089)
VTGCFLEKNEMDDNLIPAYVAAAAALFGLPLDDARAGRVATHLQRTAGMAALLANAPLLVEDEPAEIYLPAVFPALPDGRRQP